MGIHHNVTPNQQVYEDWWFNVTGDDWPVPLHFLEKFAEQVAERAWDDGYMADVRWPNGDVYAYEPALLRKHV